MLLTEINIQTILSLFFLVIMGGLVMLTTVLCVAERVLYTKAESVWWQQPDGQVIFQRDRLVKSFVPT